MSQTFFLSHGFLLPHVADSAKVNNMLLKGKFVRRFPIGKTLISMKKSASETELDDWIKEQMAPILRRPHDKMQVPGKNYGFSTYYWEPAPPGSGAYSQSVLASSTDFDLSSNVSTAPLILPPPQQKTLSFHDILSVAVPLCVSCICYLLLTTSKPRNVIPAAQDLHKNAETTHPQDNIENTEMLRDDDMENMCSELRRTREELLNQIAETNKNLTDKLDSMTTNVDESSLTKYVAALEEIEDISDDAYRKAMKKSMNLDWREMFIAMSNEKKREWVLRL
jgi:hypothetical protein